MEVVVVVVVTTASSFSFSFLKTISTIILYSCILQQSLLGLIDITAIPKDKAEELLE